MLTHVPQPDSFYSMAQYRSRSRNLGRSSIYHSSSNLSTNRRQPLSSRPSIISDTQSWNDYLRVENPVQNASTSQFSRHKSTRNSSDSERTPRRYHPSLKSTSSLQSEGRFSTRPSSIDLPEFETVPFLTWRLTLDNDKRSKYEIDQNLIQLLRKLNAAIDSDSTKHLFIDSFQCTKEELDERSSSFLQRSVRSDTRSEEFQSQRSQGSSSSITRMNSDESSLAQSRSTIADSTFSHPESVPDTATIFGESDKGFSRANSETTASGFLPSRTQDPGNVVGARKEQKLASEKGFNSTPKIHSGGQFLIGDLLEISQSILWSFLPKESVSSINTVCQRFWGSMDIISRVSNTNTPFQL
jgi:hypothetical protein